MSGNANIHAWMFDMAFNCFRNNSHTKPVIMFFLDIARLKVKIISESSVYSWVDCGTSCLQTRFLCRVQLQGKF